jgi:signal transduction histidine kinase
MARAAWRDLTSAPASFTMAAVVVSATFASIVATGAEAGTWPRAATVAGQLLLPAALGSAVFLCIACRLYPRDGVAWLAAAATMIGVQSLPTLAVADGGSELAEQAPISSAIVLGLTLLLLVRVAEGRSLRVAPIPVGIGIGLVLVLVRVLWIHVPVSDVEDWWSRSTPGGAGDIEAAACVLLVAVAVVLATAVARRSNLPKGHRRIVVAALLWPAPQALSGLGWTESPGWSVVAILCGLATCVLLMSAALDLLWLAVRDDQLAVRNLQKQLITMRERAREGIEQLHEVKGTIAGIASATNLIRYEERLTHQHREHLEELLATETARLHRLVHTQAVERTAPPTDLADVLRPLVLAHRIQGQDVSWNAPAYPVRGEGDDLAEAVNILLQNAAEHAPGASVRISTRGGGAELVIADDGPGVPPELRDHIFEWGYSGPGSSGQGVGLAVAQRLLEQHGRSLRLDPQHHPGAAFVIGLGQPATEGRHGDASVLTG